MKAEGNRESVQASTAEDGEGDILQFLFSQIAVEAVGRPIVTGEVSDPETRVRSSWRIERLSPSSFFLLEYIEMEG